MQVKFCGMTNLDDALEAARLGAWAIGLNHHPGSPRYCEPDAAVEISAALKRRLEIAGVFVDAPLDEIAAARRTSP
jgi:phosphoribosylanthranilate isomerase